MENESEITEKRQTNRIAPHHVVQHVIQKSLCGPTRTLRENWYQERCEAEKRLLDLSRGRLVLLSRVYSRDEERHQIVHEECCRPFWASMSEVQKVGPDLICPYCNIADDLTRFGSIEQIQHYVIETSESAAYFYASNHLGAPSESYSFLCMLHRRLFRATFSNFQETRGTTNGCPLCMAEAGAVTNME